MSEKIYAWLLRLYPSHFLEAYGHEALQLFWDRARNEKGLFSCLRLWFDLLVELAFSVPRQRFYAQPKAIGASASSNGHGLHVFYPLEGEAPCPGALLSGGAMSLVALSTAWILLGHGGSTPTRLMASRELQGYSRLSHEESGAQSHPAGGGGPSWLSFIGHAKRRAMVIGFVSM